MQETYTLMRVFWGLHIRVQINSASQNVGFYRRDAEVGRIFTASLHLCGYNCIPTCIKGILKENLSIAICSSVLLLPEKIHRGAAFWPIEFMQQKCATQQTMIVALQLVNKKITSKLLVLNKSPPAS